MVAVAGTQANLTKFKRQGYVVKHPPLTTPWTYEVGTNPWTEYPRPQLQRSQWQNLNGIWRYQRASRREDVNSPPRGDTLPHEVLIPSCLESGLSGERHSTPMVPIHTLLLHRVAC
jgi:hypothetical protein